MLVGVVVILGSLLQFAGLDESHRDDITSCEIEDVIETYSSLSRLSFSGKLSNEYFDGGISVLNKVTRFRVELERSGILSIRYGMGRPLSEEEVSIENGVYLVRSMDGVDKYPTLKKVLSAVYGTSSGLSYEIPKFFYFHELGNDAESEEFDSCKSEEGGVIQCTYLKLVGKDRLKVVEKYYTRDNGCIIYKVEKLRFKNDDPIGETTTIIENIDMGKVGLGE